MIVTVVRQLGFALRVETELNITTCLLNFCSCSAQKTLSNFLSKHWNTLAGWLHPGWLLLVQLELPCDTQYPCGNNWQKQRISRRISAPSYMRSRRKIELTELTKHAWTNRHLRSMPGPVGHSQHSKPEPKLAHHFRFYHRLCSIDIQSHQGIA